MKKLRRKDPVELHRVVMVCCPNLYGIHKETPHVRAMFWDWLEVKWDATLEDYKRIIRQNPKYRNSEAIISPCLTCIKAGK